MTLSKRKIKKAKCKYINGRQLTRKEANILAKRWGYSQYYYGMSKLNKNISALTIEKRIAISKGFYERRTDREEIYL